MALDIEQIKKKLGQLEGKNENKLTLKEGETVTVRILPTPDSLPFRDFYFHYGIAKQTILCPRRNYGEDCAVCNFANELWDSKDEQQKTLAKDFFAKQRFFSAVLVRGEESKGPKVWGYSKTVGGDLMKLVVNPDYGDITDADNGTDLDLTLEKAPGVSYPSTRVTPKRKTSPIMPKKAEVAKVLEGVPDLMALYPRRTPAEVAALMDAHLDKDSSGEMTPEDDSLAARIDQALEA